MPWQYRSVYRDLAAAVLFHALPLLVREPAGSGMRPMTTPTAVSAAPLELLAVT